MYKVRGKAVWEQRDSALEEGMGAKGQFKLVITDPTLDHR